MRPSSTVATEKTLTPKKRELLELLLQEKKQKSERTAVRATPLPIPQRKVFSPAPVSFAQQRLWFLDQLTPGSPAFNIPAAVRLKGALNVELLRKAFAEIMRRHETLRTSFASQEGTPLQVISPSVDLEIPIVDLRSEPESERMEEVQRQITQDCQRSFDLSRPPLFRVTLVLLDKDDHVLVLMMHHIISDVWSVRLLMKELAKLYEAFSCSSSPSLPQLPIQYADYAAWQRERLQGSALDAELGYWTKQLAGMPEELELPLDHPRPPVQSIWGAKYFLKVPKAVDDAVRVLGRVHGASLYMTLLAAWKALLHRYTGQEDIVVGAPVANRNRSEYENMIGFFVNSVLLRTDLSGEPAFLELLARVREMVLGAFSHQDFPFERLVEALQPARNMSRNPLYQTDVILQNAPTAAYSVTNMSFEPLPVQTGTAQLDMTLDLWEEADGIGGWLEYDTDLFDRTTASRMVDHYLSLLERIVENPNLPVSQIRLLSAMEERQLLVEWSTTRREYDLESAYPQLFEKQVRVRGSEIAVICGAEQRTYEQLNCRANQIAWLLIEEGVGPDDITALLATRSVDFLAAVLGVFKAGGAYLPLDPYHPPKRHRQILRQSRTQTVLCARAFLPLLQEAIRELGAQPPKILILEDLEKIPRSKEDPPLRCLPDNLAYVLFTSGSTGVPKGVMIHHRGMINHIWATVELLGMHASDVMVQTASQCFDVSVWQFLTPLVLGGRVHIFRDEITKDPPRLLQEVDRRGITIFQTVPSLLQVALAETRGPDAPKLRALRWMLSGGEANPSQLCREWLTEYPQIPLVNAFGPSECSDDVALYPMHELSQIGDLRVPIGYPVANLRIVILDRNRRLVPVGVAGELCVSGVGLGRGYLNEPDRTAAAFIPDPFSKEPGGRMYRSGDRARYLADGRLEFLGRFDHQVKIRGFRIELGEIEALLRSHPAVQEAAVIVNQDSPGDGRLIAYVTPREHGELNCNEIQEYLRQRLPEYMVPAALMSLERLPLTRNGKLDRQALPAPEKDISALEFTAPSNPIEEALANIWGDILGLEKVSVERNLFELGAHSLLVTQVVSRIRKAFAIEPPLRSFFESPTVAGMAKVIEQLKAEEGTPVPPIVRTPRDGNYLLSFTQERMWFLDQLEPGLAAYNVPGAVYMDGSLKVFALEHAFAEILRRHEVFRTTYQGVDGIPVQVIHPPRPFDIPVVDLSALQEEHREAEALRVANENAQRPFDLLRGPVLRVFLMRCDKLRHLLAMTTHHIAYDMWAREIFIYELGTLYEEYVKGHPSALDEPELQWVDYASWQRQWMRGEVLEKQLEYWRKKLADAPRFIDLPVDLPRPPVQSYKAARQYLELPGDVVRALRAFSRKHGVTPFITFLAAFKALLYRWTGQEHLVIGTPIANRNRMEVEKLIGWMANTLVFNTQLNGHLTFVDLLERVRETSLGAYAHQDIPFDLLVQDLQPERSLSRPPIFQVMFNYMLNYSAPSVSLSDLTLRLERLYSGAAHFEITVNVWEIEDGLNGVIEYCTELFYNSTITRLTSHFRTLLQGIAANPERRIAELPLLSAAELEQILLEWNATARQYSSAQGFMHQQIEQQAAAHPLDMAVVFEGQELSYRELNQRANQLAWKLRSMGAGRGSLVGIFMERSLEMVVGLLGILKSGAAYLPLDPGYPQERLAYMMKDAQPRVLLTQERLLALLPHHDAQLLVLDNPWQGTGNDESQTRPFENLELADDDLAYVIYTSGSTGQPKGAMNTHGAIRNRLLWMQEQYQLERRDRVLQKTPFSFDVSVWEFFWPLMVGARLVVARPGGHQDNRYLVALIQQEQISTLHFVPSMLQMFLEEGGVEKCKSLKRVICSGEALPHELQERFFARLSCELHNLYGPTEAAVDVTYWECRKQDELRSVPIGRPIANTQMYVLDREMQPVAVGVAGELYIGGQGLGRGYWKRAGLTAEKFVPNPYVRGERLYRTGDIGRFWEDGSIEYLGRVDHQVKLRGFRIELGEIESALAQHESIREVAVVAREDQPGDKRLVAYIVPVGRWAPSGPGVYELPNGLAVLQQNKNETDYLYDEIFVRQSYVQNGIELPEDACVFDVGANIGLFSLFVGEHCPRGEVYAFEPIAPVYEKLVKNLRQSPAKVKTYAVGLGAEEGDAEFVYYPRHSMMSSRIIYADSSGAEAIVKQYLQNQQQEGIIEAQQLLQEADEILAGQLAGEKLKCHLASLSSVIRQENVNRIDLLKVDVEGAELEVLRGIAQEDWSKIWQVVVESHGSEERLQGVRALLEGHGFTVEVEQEKLLQGTEMFNLYGRRAGARLREAQAKSAPAAAMSTAQLREHLRQRLPEYMVPSAFVLLEKMPLSPNGKVDRKTLPSPETGRSDISKPYVAPRTIMEQTVAAIFTELLRIDRVGALDNFFDLGGHSLLAMQVRSRVDNAFSVDVPLRLFFENPTVHGLAQTVQALQWAAQSASETCDHESSEIQAAMEEGTI